MGGPFPTPTPVPDHQRSGNKLLPRHAIGWWTLISLIVTGSYPLYFSALGHAAPDSVRIAISLLLAGTSLLLSRESILRRRDPAISLVVLFWIVALEVAVGVLFGLALLGQAL